MEFVHLQCQTVYSLLKSTCTINKLVQRAKCLGMKALAITDENVMYGVIPFYKACIREEIQPIIGLTAFVLEEESSYPLILLAENETGYHNLLKISSTIMTKSKTGIPKKWISHYADGLIAISPGRKGEIEQYVLQQNENKAREAIRSFKSIFPKFYVSLQNHHSPEEELLLARLLVLSKEEDVPVVATNDVRYLDKEDSIVHECLLSIENGTKITDPSRPRYDSNEYELASAEEMIDRFSSVPEAISNSIEIASMCKVNIPFHQNRLPTFPISTDETSDTFLHRICEEGLHKRYQVVTNIHRKRLEHELHIISNMGFSDYFLIVWDFMKYAHSHGIITGPGRGSAAGSLVAYILEITDIDPIAYDLLFERFLNPQRVTLPDIDIDFPDVRRDEMIRYVSEKYGDHHVAQIVTFGTLAAKAAIRDVARTYGLPPKEVDYLAKLIPSRSGITLEEAYNESEPLRKHIQSSPLFEQIYTIAIKVEGLPRHTSVHAAGIIMSDMPLTDHVAIQEGHIVYITQYPAEVLEELGLLKMDFLGLRNLTILDQIQKLIQESKGVEIDYRQIPLHDRRTFALLSKGDTTGVFQLESAGMRNVLRSLKPTEFEDIVAVNALYRPGPMEQIPLFIDSKYGRHPIQYLHKDLEPILSRTYGVIVYQEQIMQIASVMAGFSLGEADLLRRAVSKKNHDILDKERDHFVTGCIQNGYEEKVAHAVYDYIVRFANYGFNRSHAVAYSMIAYQLAYIKANYPLEFMTALLSSVIGSEDKIVQYVQETKRKGIRILPPSILNSSFSFQVEGEAIRYSLVALRNIGVATVKEILDERQKRPFTDLFDFCIRLPNRVVTRKIVETLICSGCFDDFQVDRASLLASIETALDYVELVKPNDGSQMDMLLDEDLVPKPQYVQVEPIPFMEKLKLEKEIIGLYVSSYPTFVYEELIQRLRIPTLKDVLTKNQKYVRSIVFLSNVRVIRTKKLQKMAFLTICDEGEELEAVMFPDTYLQFASLLKEESIMLIVGNISFRNNRKQWIMEGIYPLANAEEYKRYEHTSVYIKLPSKQETAIAKHVRKIIYRHPGYSNVFIYYEKEHKMVQLSYIYSVHPDEGCLQELRNIVGQENVVCKI
ncbi:DNA polymerase III subunit alpha [Ectobacillus polymachus]|uniref:DNA polymerase III subunit alpha n=1 Tax=Ectobacillus polymachus TaxID=1508806 RepID=UPI003A8BC498